MNNGGATRADVLFLVEMAQKKVKEELGINLIREVVLMEPKRIS